MAELKECGQNMRDYLTLADNNDLVETMPKEIQAVFKTKDEVTQWYDNIKIIKSCDYSCFLK